MGSNVSSIKSIKQNEYILKIISVNPIPPSDTKFWNEFLSFAFSNLDGICSDSKFIDEYIIPLLSQWMDNNPQSCNLSSFIEVLIQKIEILKKDSDDSTNYNIVIWHAFNLMFILRNFAKYLIETLNEEKLIKHFQLPSTDGGNNEDSGAVVIESLLNSLIEVLVDVKLTNLTYNLHVEACKTFLVLLSVQMFFFRPSTKSLIYTTVMQKKCSIHALLFTKVLLNNFIHQIPAPPPSTGSIIFGLASGLWSVLTLGYGNKKSEEEILKEAILARESLLLLLVLTNHCTKEINPYREALFECNDNSDITDQNMPGFKVEFGKLYKTLCTTLNDDQSTLLMYMLLHKNPHFKTFVLSRTTDLDQFVIPLLKILYTSSQRNTHHIYMSLIILLVLSEDNLFCKTIHDISIKNVTWYTDRNITEISLGGLIILVILRVIHHNSYHNRDRFLHTNLCATIANLSNCFKHLNIQVCQKLVILFEKISKTYIKMQKSIEQSKLDKPNGINHDGDSNEISAETDCSLFEEVLRTILEIMNACLTKNLTNNPNLIYQLLYNRKVFDPFLANSSFQIIFNIETVLSYFSSKIGENSEEGGGRSVEEVFEIIKHASLNFSNEKLKKFPEPMFHYVEDEQPEDFFIPYIWSLVFRCSNIFWSSQNILLFNPVRSNNNNSG